MVIGGLIFLDFKKGDEVNMMLSFILRFHRLDINFKQNLDKVGYLNFYF